MMCFLFTVVVKRVLSWRLRRLRNLYVVLFRRTIRSDHYFVSVSMCSKAVCE